MTQFGSFARLCKDSPIPWCNLFIRQISRHAPSILLPPSSDISSAPVGFNPPCAINHIHHPSSFGGRSDGNVALIVSSVFSFIWVLFLITRVSHRSAAVGRIEFRTFLLLYALSLPLQILTSSSLLSQSSLPLIMIVLTSLHSALVVSLFFVLLWFGIVSTQWIDDGSLSSVIPMYTIASALFILTTYISLDVALSITSTFGPSNPPQDLLSIPLFVLTQIWPAAATLIYFGIMLWVILHVLQEIPPVWYFVLSLAIFVLAQLDFYILSRTICQGTKAKIDGSFIATLLNTLSIAILYLGWTHITEESWDDEVYRPYEGPAQAPNSIGL
ncbi:hypothetical protein SISSUDRAFT_318192 [Sistotremastrum suecicum HHB10207 ss-3]|uniref:Uncharacterized protein n=1 Tax=Sistotremastrum suecicum HHB10207 ss-3 TaxID=1314776 RepID=A0A165Z8I2_9AGAM|nr:hypothetical protein SISSUDRAFT_318192 [Sistotremastrum suecicum HHB10207 ss-3]